MNGNHSSIKFFRSRRCNILRFLLVFSILLFALPVLAQQDTPPPSVDPRLMEILTARSPKIFTIAGIEVSGTRSFDQNLIISISGLAVGDKVQIPGTDAFSKAITKLWKQNLISNARINFLKLDGNDLYIELEIVERPRLLDFSFTGIRKGEKDDLEGKVALSKDRVVTENMKMNAIEAIRKYYLEKCYRNVVIQVTETAAPNEANAVQLNFDIQKGSKVRIHQINFTGNESVTDLRLKKQMKGTKETSRLTLFPETYIGPYGDTLKKSSTSSYLRDAGFLSITKTKDYLDPYFRFKLFSSSKFSEKKYLEDKDRIMDYYNARGYRDAMLLADTLFYSQQGDLNIDIKLNEGRKYFFGNINWKGNSKYSDDFLNIVLGIKKGDVYNVETLNKRLGKTLTAEGGDISSLYMDDGYLFFRVDPVETSVYNDTIDFEIRIMEGPQATYGRITVTGNNKTKDYVVLRELRTLPGDKFSRADIIRTQRELSQLGFFNPEKISPNVIPNAENGTVDINWQVEEKSSDQLELSAGFGGGIGLTGTLGVSFNNFSIKNIFDKETWDPLPTGDGQKLSLRAQSNGKAYRAYNFGFTEPWFGGKKRNSFSINYYNTRYARTFDQFGSYCRDCGDTSYIKTIGFGISLGKQLKWPDDYFTLIYSLNYQKYELMNYPNIFKGINTGSSSNVNLKMTLLRSSAGPNPVFPTSGSDFMLSGQFTIPYSLLGLKSGSDNKYSLAEYHKWRFSGEWYVPIGKARGADRNKQFVFKAAAKYGFIGRYNLNKEVSPFERFQLGDAGLSNTQALLGYDIIAHRGFPIYGNSDPKVNPDGITPTEFFTIFNKYTFELRYPFSTAATSTIYGLGFFEAANGWFKASDFNPFKLRRSVGLGMRFMLPMFGLLGFDYGIGIDRYNANGGLKGAAKFTFMLGREPE